MQIRLIGVPRMVGADGVIRELRGQKPWALLARILLADRPLTRRELSSELFPDANDPLGSLRWSLAELRRAIGEAGAFTGDPVHQRLPDHVDVDVLALERADLHEIGTGGLLDNIEPSGSPQFTTWLLVARQHVAGRVDAALHQQVVTALTRGRADEAVRHAGLAARRSPFDERAHVLLVRSLVASGRQQAAVAHVAHVEATFRCELGCEPSPALRSAARRTIADPPPGVPVATQVQALIDAGHNALAAGASDAGLDCLRRAAAIAESAQDEALEAFALLELGTALIHSVRGFDDEGSLLLARATDLAVRAGRRPIAVRSLTERAYADTLVGRRHQAVTTLALARELADGDRTLLPEVIAHEAFNLGDWGRHAEALERFDEALGAADAANDRRLKAWVLSLGAWQALRAGQPERAKEWAGDGAALAQDLRWSSFEPLPAMVLAEADLAADAGDVPLIALERVFAASCQLRDPCWEGGTARVLALHHAAAGDLPSALRWITDAHERCTRVTDTWAAMVGEILLTEAQLRRMGGDPHGSEAAAREAVAHAARTHLDSTLARALTVLQAG